MPRAYNPKVRCTAKGGTCRRAAIKGGTVCPTHGGQAPQVKAMAAKRIAAEEACKAFGLPRSQDPNRALAEVGCIAFVRAGDLYDEDGKLIESADNLPGEVQAAIAQTESITGNVDTGDGKKDQLIRVRFYDKIKALDILAKYHRLYEERVNLHGEISLGWKD